MILSETNILIEFYKKRPDIIIQLAKIGVNNLAISVIPQGELYYGALNKRELNKIRKHLDFLYVFPVNELICFQFIQIMENYSLSYKLTIPDALIAFTAIVNQVELYTLNTKDFYFIQELKIYCP